MTTYQIFCNGSDFGTYDATDAGAAIEQSIRDAGYRDAAHGADVLGKSESEFLAANGDGTSVWDGLTKDEALARAQQLANESGEPALITGGTWDAEEEAWSYEREIRPEHA